MIHTKDGVSIWAGGSSEILINRSTNTATLKLTMVEALRLITDLGDAFGIGGVPSRAHYEEIYVVIESPTGFYPKDMD